MNYLAVYLAGKISKHGWRDKIVSHFPEDEYAETKVNGVISCGPFFIACDHGCYHGDNSHGVGAYETGEEFPERCEGKGTPQALVPTVCTNQIDKSNFVFAYIDSDSCYGTLCEIGYAIGKNIPVAVMFSKKTLKRDMWFIAEIVNIVFNGCADMMKCEIKKKEIFFAAQNIADLIAGGDIEWESPS